jgi:Phage terminase large subunit (GpA)
MGPHRVAGTAWRCPSCAGLVPEKAKFAMVTAREWRATRPEIKGHAGFRCSALISLLANASWGRLAEEFLAARNDPAALMTFVNTVLGEVWADPANGTASCGAPGGREPHPKRAQSPAIGKSVTILVSQLRHSRFAKNVSALGTWLRDRLGALDYPVQKRASK